MKIKIALTLIVCITVLGHLYGTMLVWMQLDWFHNLAGSQAVESWDNYINYELAYRYFDFNYILICFLGFIKLLLSLANNQVRLRVRLFSLIGRIAFILYSLGFNWFFYERVFGYYSMKLDFSTYTEIVNTTVSLCLLTNVILIVFVISLLFKLYSSKYFSEYEL